MAAAVLGRSIALRIDVIGLRIVWIVERTSAIDEKTCGIVPRTEGMPGMTGVHEIGWRIAGIAGRTCAIGVGRQEPVPVNKSTWTEGSAITARASAAGWARVARTEAPTLKARSAAVGENPRGAGAEEHGGVVLGGAELEAGVAAGVTDDKMKK